MGIIKNTIFGSENEGSTSFHNLDNKPFDIANNRYMPTDIWYSNSYGTTPYKVPSAFPYEGAINPNPYASLESLSYNYAKILKNLPKIYCKRIIIRKIEKSDAKNMFEYAKNKEVAKHVLWDAHRSVEDSMSVINYIQRLYKLGEPSSMAIALKDSNRIIGTIGYSKIDIEHNSAEIGYSLDMLEWNKGYMTEALMAMIDFSFRYLRLNRLEAQHELDNPASGVVLKKCGFVEEGLLRKRLYNKTTYADVKLYSILYEDYKNILEVRNGKI